MTTYIKNYRKIYEDNFGPIPLDSDGRTYDIHHIDGNHNNNDPTNLKAVSIKEHYDIHYSQGDYYACLMISSRMDISPKAIMDKITELGLNPFSKRLDGTSIQTDRVKSGTHHLLKRKDGTSIASDLVKQGKNKLLKRPDGSSISSDMVKNGTHYFIGVVSCRDIYGNIVKITKEEYNNQTGPMENWNYVHNTSKEGQRRKLLKNPNANVIKTKEGTVPCYDESGKFKRISNNEYFSQSGPKENWQFIHVSSKQAQKRKKC